MSDNIAEATALLAEYIDRLGEQAGGMGEIKTFCEGAAADMVRIHGSETEAAGKFSSAMTQAEVIQGLVINVKTEMEQLQELLGSMT